jgi:hypothetical protein
MSDWTEQRGAEIAKVTNEKRLQSALNANQTSGRRGDWFLEACSGRLFVSLCTERILFVRSAARCNGAVVAAAFWACN